MSDVEAAEKRKKIILDGLWHNNAGLVQLLGLCPLLAVTSNVINGLGLGIATTVTLMCSSLLVSSIRHTLRAEIRIPIYVLIIASTVTAIELLMRAWLHELYTVLGIFIPLIVTNCVIMGRAEAFAARNPLPLAALDAAAMSAGFTLLLVIIGGIRELLGQGTLFAQAHLMFGPSAENWVLTFGDDYPGFLLAILPPGAFFVLGFLIALKNVIDQKLAARRKAAAAAVPTEPSSA